MNKSIGKFSYAGKIGYTEAAAGSRDPGVIEQLQVGQFIRTCVCGGVLGKGWEVLRDEAGG